VGGQARVNRRRRHEGACNGCCVEAERGSNGERGSGPAHAKRGGVGVRCTWRGGRWGPAADSSSGTAEAATGRIPAVRSMGIAGHVGHGCCGLGPIGTVWFLS
jgi:hypothetical protein